VSAFYEPLAGGRYRSTEHTAGPWDPRSQHAGPPAALLGRALEQCEPRADTLLSRITYEILGPVPVAEVEVEARVVRPGRWGALLAAPRRAAGRPAMTARAWRLPLATAPEAGHGEPPIARPGQADPPPHDFGYGHALECRFAVGGWREPGPAVVWTRLRVGIVPDEQPTPLQRVLAVADSGNGVSAVLPWDDWLFINPELTVHVLRPAVGEWIVLDAETRIGAGGLARSVMSDDAGPVAYGAQSLCVAPR
jgi:hypothetical protein